MIRGNGAAGPRPSSAGFTLVEMLVSLAIMGMAAVILAGGIERIGLGTQIADRTGNQLDALAAAQRLLRQRLTAIEPLRDGQTSGTALDFTGERESIEFIGRTADRTAPDALQRYRLQRDSNGDLTLLSLSTLDPRTDPHSRQTQGWTRLALLSGVTRISISYLGQNRLVADQHAVWQPEWSSRASLPMLVRIGLGFADGDRRQWPDLVVHPRAATPDPCVRDAVTGGCATGGALMMPSNLET